ncbi:hypothetical protein BJY01DRAFT_251919 [Aspergillus pseudoustus]|uniref:Uncharacterized protein n=1 Tax=Aspergillus pseudoustus TaxID=1810923 RepID=A0ABR4J955_9EURO
MYRVYEADLAPFDPRGLTADAHSSEIPDRLSPTSPRFGSETPLPECTRGAAYETLDTNAGARTMAFTHTPLPVQNWIGSIRKFGRDNLSRPRRAVLRYLEDLFVPHLHLLVLNTSAEKVEKFEEEEGRRWKLTLRRRGISKDYWWQEMFDAVVAASGHFTVPIYQPSRACWRPGPSFPASSSIRSPTGHRKFMSTRCVARVGRGLLSHLQPGPMHSANRTLPEDLHDIVRGPLYVSRRGEVGFLEDAWRLPNVVSKPTVKRISSEAGGTVVEFSDGTRIQGFDKIIFATGYKLSYPFLPFAAATPENRLAGFYQHIFHRGDPSLAVIGQVSPSDDQLPRLRVPGRGSEPVSVWKIRCPSQRGRSKRKWEDSRLAYKGPTELFHEIKPDFAEYYGWLREFAGRKREEDNEPSGGYLLPAFDESWIQSDIEILQARQRHWARVRAKIKPLDYDVPQHCL